jgi:hypothetical protein
MTKKKPSRAELERRVHELEGELIGLRSTVQVLTNALAGPNRTVVVPIAQPPSYPSVPWITISDGTTPVVPLTFEPVPYTPPGGVITVCGGYPQFYSGLIDSAH